MCIVSFSVSSNTLSFSQRLDKLHNRRVHLLARTVSPAVSTAHDDPQGRPDVHRPLPAAHVHLRVGYLMLLAGCMEPAGPVHGGRVAEFAGRLHGLADTGVLHLHSSDQRRTTALYSARHGSGIASAQYGF